MEQNIADLKTRIKNGETVFGTFVKLNSPQIVEMLQYAGLDFIVIDMEHSAIDFSQAENLTRAAGTMKTIIRIPSSAEEHVLHALDAGVAGVQVPGLTSAKEAEPVVSCGKYHPIGRRGLSFNQRSARYGFVDKETYMKEKNEESLVVIHIENREMVNELELLCENPQVDVLFIGPMDLSQSYGTPGNSGSPEVKAVVDQIIDTARKNGKATGIFATTEKEMQEYAAKGVQYILWSSDIGFCSAGAKNYMKAANEIQALKTTD